LNRLWRSRPVAIVALLLVLALVAAACSSDDGGTEGEDTTTTTAAPEESTTTTAAPEETTTTTEASLEKAYGGEAIVGDSQYPATLNGFVNNNSIVSIVGQMWASGTQVIDGNTLELVPELVTELPSVANGGVVVNEDGTMTVSYQIKDEAVWEDGTPVSGADYQFTLDTIMETELAIKSVYEDIVATEVGDKTFSYTLAAPTLQFELVFGELLPSHQLAELDDDFSSDWNETRWLSNGPFVFDSLSTGEFIKAVRNDAYWKTDAETGQQLPYLDSVTFRFIPETESLITAFSARELDAIQPDPGSEIIETLQALVPDGAVVEVLSGPIWEHLAFQFGDSRFERNETSCNEVAEMRLAVAQTIDKQLIVDEILAGQVEPLDSYVAAYAPTLSQDAWSQYTLDPAAANENYLAAVEASGKECSVTFSTTSNNDARVKLSELFVAMFEASGIPYENSLEDSSLFFGDTFDTGTWDLGEWAWLGTPGLAGLVSIHDVWSPTQEISAAPYQWGRDGAGAYTDDQTARFVEVYEALNSTVDNEELVGLIAEAEQLLADNLVFFPLYTRLTVGAAWGDEIGGYKHNPTQESHTWNIEEWYRVDL
jgi:peptide/nickel transport system substrate-binding protein